MSVTVRRLRGDEVSAERVEVKEPGGKEGGRRDGEGGRTARDACQGPTTLQQKIKVSPHDYKDKSGLRNFPRHQSKTKRTVSYFIAGASRDVCVSLEHTTLNLAQVLAEKNQGRSVLLLFFFFQKCSFQPDKFKHSDLEALAAPAVLTRPRQQEDNNLSRNKIEMSLQSG